MDGDVAAAEFWFEKRDDRILRQTELDTDDTERSLFSSSPYSDFSTEGVEMIQGL